MDSKLIPNQNQTFHNKLFGDLTVLTHQDGNILFVAKEVADKLGYEDASKMYARIDEEDKQTVNIKDFAPAITAVANSKTRTMILINESGLYSAVLGSKKEEAKKFKKWVTSEIIPSIRKTGSYSQQPAELSRKDLILLALKTEEHNEKLQLELKEKAPLIGFAETVQKADKGMLVNALAHLVQNESEIKGKIGAKRLWDWLRLQGLIQKNSTLPTQKSEELGLFYVKPIPIAHTSGVQEHTTTMVTGKGQIYITEKLKQHFKENAQSEQTIH